jgi:ribosome maturation factor RimP
LFFTIKCLYLCAKVEFFGFRGQQSPILLSRLKMITKEQILEIINKKIDLQDRFLVDININPGNKIEVFFDSNKGISLSECAEISRIIETELNNNIEDFELEVSSPGLTQPFKVLEQYKKNIGNEVEVVMKNGFKSKGRLMTVLENGINVEENKIVKEGNRNKKITIKEQLFIDFKEIKYTKEVLIFKKFDK